MLGKRALAAAVMSDNRYKSPFTDFEIDIRKRR
jgi:hypothetical protein